MDEKMEVFEKHRTDPSEEDKNINREENVLPDFDMIDKTGHETKRTRPTKQVPDVIIIEDDDEIGEVENHDTSNMDDFCDDDYDSDSGSRKFQSCSNRPAGGQSADGFSAGHSEFSDSSDEDDCFVMNHEPMEPGPSRLSWCLHRRVPKGEKRPAHNMFNLNNMRKSSSSSSDCEIIEDLDGKVRQDWEKAALKKRLGDAFNGGIYRAESEESTSASNLAGSVARQSLHGKTKGQAQQNEMSKQGQSEPRQSGPSNFPFPKERESTPVTLFDQQDSNHDCPDARSEDASDLAGEGTSVSETASISSGNDAESFEERTSSSHLNAVQIGSSDDYLSGVLPPEEDFLVPERESDDLQQQQVAAEAVLKSSDDLFVDRERIKETEEFRHAEEEEWARRQQELQRQAQEAQRQRKKRKVEAERRMEMESRQKQRLEEIRQIQQKEEQNLGYKEQVRGRIRSELEDVAATCIDMATLLRNLGVEVDGGVFPSIQQVNAAYKKALLRFHPDRVAASAKREGDTSLIKTSKLRPSLVWSNGQWVLWTDTKDKNNVLLKAGNNTHEGETPVAKRQKTEKVQASTANDSKQKAVAASTMEKAPTHKEGSHPDSAAARLLRDGKGFAVDAVDKSKQQGSKVVFGVPKPTKKRRFIEVSKHYVSSKGARSTLDVKATRKHEDPSVATLEFRLGSAEAIKSDSLKAKKNIPSSQRTRAHKGAEGVETAQTKSSAARNQKEKPFSDTKMLGQKDALTRQGLPSGSKNAEGKLLRKKVPSAGGQPESQKKPEVILTAEATVQKVAPLTSAAISENLNKKPSSVLVKESGKEPSHPAKKVEKSVEESEKRPSHPVKESEGEPSNPVKEREGEPSHPVQERKKQPSHPVQEKEKLSHPVKGREKPPPHPVKENEKQPVKGSEKPCDPVKESEKQPSQAVKESEKPDYSPSNPVKESEKPSQPVRESENQPLNPVMEREKQPSSSVKESEKQPSQLTKENDKGKDVGRSGSEIWEPRRTSRKIRPTSKLLEGLQTAPIGKSSIPYDKGSRSAPKGSTSTLNGPPSPQKQ